MTVCIDTNVVLGMFTARHLCRPIFDAWFAGELRWAVTTEILLEYEEVMQRQAGPQKAATMLRLIDWVDARHGTMIFLSPAFRFHLITLDPDDDKFVDCAVAAAAEYIITDDQHFALLSGSGHKPQPITPRHFIQQQLRRR